MRPVRVVIIISAAITTAIICAFVLSFATPNASLLGTIIVAPFAAMGAMLYAALRKRGPVRWLTALAAGFTFAALPSLLLSLGMAPDSASISGVPTVVNGHYTAAGWREGLLFSGGIGAAGAGAAIVFYLLVRRDALAQTIRWADTRPALATAMLAFCALGYVDYASVDRSCHNPFRNGGRSLAPVAEVKVHVEPADWQALGDELLAFGRPGGWSILSHREWELGSQVVTVDLCKEPGTQITLNVMRFPPESASIFEHEVDVSVFQPQGGESWRAPFGALTARLVRRWPGRVDAKPTGENPRPK